MTLKNQLWNMKLFLALACMLEIFVCNAVFASDQKSTQPSIERIGGDFNVTRINKLADGGFRVEFESDHPDAPYKRLTLDSSHVHVAVYEGQKIRLSADVKKLSRGAASVSQMVIFIPGREGSTPVWLLSKNVPSEPGPPAKLLEMHAPGTDFQLL
jgi:hypothetical protein